jgi:preprotein translocase subunit SecF
VPGSQVTLFGGSDEFLIRTPRTVGDAATSLPTSVVAALSGQYGEENVRASATEAVSGKVGGELQTRPSSPSSSRSLPR